MQYVYVVMVQRQGFDFIGGVFANIDAAKTERDRWIASDVDAQNIRISAEPLLDK